MTIGKEEDDRQRERNLFKKPQQLMCLQEMKRRREKGMAVNGGVGETEELIWNKMKAYGSYINNDEYRRTNWVLK